MSDKEREAIFTEAERCPRCKGVGFIGTAVDVGGKPIPKPQEWTEEMLSRLFDSECSPEEAIKRICALHSAQLAAEQEKCEGLIKDYQAECDRSVGFEQQLATEQEAAKKLCEIYFNIAAKEVGEDEVRRRRDAALAKVKEGK